MEKKEEKKKEEEGQLGKKRKKNTRLGGFESSTIPVKDRHSCQR